MHKIKKQFIFFCSLILFSAEAATAQDMPNTATLFIHSNPINATVIFDEKPVFQKTPVLLSGIDSGLHTISIRKEGFAPEEYSITLEPGEIRVFEAGLLSGKIVNSIPESSAIYLETDKERLIPHSFKLPEGSYSYTKKDGRLYIKPEYPKEKYLTINSTLFATALAANIISAGIELHSAGDINSPYPDHLLITGAVSLTLGLIETALALDKLFFIQNFSLYGADLTKLDSEADKLFIESEKMLTRGYLEEALSGFSNLISNFPDSGHFPEALYKIARIHIISGDTNLAVFELKIIIDQYPDAGIYDKACQTLSLLYFNAGDKADAVKTVEQMVFYDPLFSDTTKDILDFGIEQVIENWARNPEGRTE